MKSYMAIIAMVLILSSLVFQQDRVSVLPNSKEKKARNDKLFIRLASFVLIFFAGVRFRVGADYSQYASNYYAYHMSDLELLKEPGIRMIAKLAHFLYDDYATMFLLMSIITIGLCTYRIAKETPFWMVSILMYVFLGCWHGTFNAVRQCAAAAILFWGHTYIKNRKFLKWVLVVLVSTLFHISAIVSLFLYWMPVRKITLKKVFLFVLVGIVLAFSYDAIWELVGFMKGTEMVVGVYETNHINVFRIIVAWIPIVFYFLCVRKFVDEEDRPAMNFYANFSLISATIVLAARYSAYLARMVVYTDLYNTIFWAYMVKDLFVHQKDIKSKRIWMLVILGCYFLYYLFEAKGVYLADYQTIFSR